MYSLGAFTYPICKFIDVGTLGLELFLGTTHETRKLKNWERRAGEKSKMIDQVSDWICIVKASGFTE